MINNIATLKELATLDALLHAAFEHMPLAAVHSNFANIEYLKQKGVPALSGAMVEEPNWSQSFLQTMKSHFGLKE